MSNLLNGQSLAAAFEIMDYDAVTTFTIKKIINNPETGDNIMLYVLFLVISTIGLVGVIIINKYLKRSIRK